MDTEVDGLLPFEVDEHQEFAPVDSAAPRQSRPEDGVFEDDGVCGYVAVGSGHGVDSDSVCKRRSMIRSYRNFTSISHPQIRDFEILKEYRALEI